MYAEISAAVASVKTVLDLAKAAHELSNHNELLSAVYEVQTKLIDATTAVIASQDKQSALNDRVEELKKQLREIENWEREIKRYKLYEFPSTKTLVYALKEGMENGEPLHYLCATCLNQDKKTILQPRGYLLFCPTCKMSIAARPAPKPATRVISKGVEKSQY